MALCAALGRGPLATESIGRAARGRCGDGDGEGDVDSGAGRGEGPRS
jgi:hypothetical protein